MTPTQLDIARRLVAAPWFPKRGDGWTTRADNDGTLYFRDANGLGWVGRRNGEYLPDLNDDGNGGVLVGMLPIGWNAFQTASGNVPVHAEADGRPCHGVGSTLAEAAALVLLEVRGG